MQSGETAMTDAGSAGMLRGWIFIWNLELMWLLAALLVGVALIAPIEIIAALRTNT
jgi:hypothetical protein